MYIPVFLLGIDWQAFVHTPGKFGCIDMFAGKANLSKAFHENGIPTCTMDFCRDERDDSLLQFYGLWMNK